MQLVILAGGKGSRLGLKDIPKPMYKIAGIPLLERQILLAKKYGINEIFLLEGYLSNVIVDYFGDGSKFGVKIHHIIEQEPLGTAGSLSMIKDHLESKFIVFYGDLVMDFDIDAMLSFDLNHKGIGTLLVHPNNHPYDSDLLEVKDDLVIAFHAKPHDPNQCYHNLVNAAVYVLSKDIFKYIENAKKQDFGKDIFPKVVLNDELLYAYRSAEYVKDMGTKDRLPYIVNDVESGKVHLLNKQNSRPAVFLDRDGVLIKDMDKDPRKENVKILPGVYEAVKKINDSGMLAIVVTNQPMIAKGFVTLNDVDDVHKLLETKLGEHGAYLDDIYICPHHPEKGFDGEVKELKIECECRKPKPGLLIKAFNDYNVDFEKSWMIGDRESDLIAGKKVNCRTILVGDILTSSNYADFQCKNLLDAINLILERTE